MFVRLVRVFVTVNVTVVLVMFVCVIVIEMLVLVTVCDAVEMFVLVRMRVIVLGRGGVIVHVRSFGTAARSYPDASPRAPDLSHEERSSEGVRFALSKFS